MTSPVARSARLVAWLGFWLARYCPFCGPRGLARLLARVGPSVTVGPVPHGDRSAGFNVNPVPRDDLKGGFNVGHGYEIVSDFSCRCPNSFNCEVVQWKHFRAVARISFVMEVLPWKHVRAVGRISFVGCRLNSGW